MNRPTLCEKNTNQEYFKRPTVVTLKKNIRKRSTTLLLTLQKCGHNKQNLGSICESKYLDLKTFRLINQQ